MEPAEIAIVLARASHLHSKLNDAILRTHTSRQQSPDPDSDVHDLQNPHSPLIHEASHYAFGHAHNLAAIRDALLALEDHLDSLQALQKQQKAERDEVLAEIEESRKILIGKLKEYNGDEWEIIEEAHAFAGEPVQRKDDLVLPPYHSPISDIASLGKDWQFANLRKRLHTPGQNSARRTSTSSLEEERQEGDELTQVETVLQQDGEQVAPRSKKFSALGVGLGNMLSGLGHGIGFTAKTAFLIASVFVVLTLSRLEPRLGDRSTQRASKLPYLGKRAEYEGAGSSPTSGGHLVQDVFCPPGKVLLVQDDGVQKCFVKERIEAPFKEVVKQPDASYGYG